MKPAHRPPKPSKAEKNGTPDVPTLGKRGGEFFQPLEKALPTPVACFISLGCDKNTVDTERLMARLIEGGFLIAERPEDSDIALVNTCGFIAEAREETRRMLEALAKGRRRGRPRRIVALGCLIERMRAATIAEPPLPADATIGFADYPRIAEICLDLLDAAAPERRPQERRDPFENGPRLLTGLPHIAALKISEGCSNRCRYCAIPLIRGPHRSRPIEALVEETRQLVASGVREISLIAQDTTAYGLDRYGARSLPRLLRALAEAAPEARFRLLYAHPRHITGELLDVLRSDAHFLPYLDLPLQHIHDRVLRDMGRGITEAEVRTLVEQIRDRWPEAALRTAYIVGFPGESEAEFDALLRWVAEGAFLHAGVFIYSKEAGTPAAELPDDVPAAEKERRRQLLMATQREVSRRRLAEWQNRVIPVMVDAPADRAARRAFGAEAVGRAEWQAPEVDGVVYLCGAARFAAGDNILARVVRTLDYDLVAEAISTVPSPTRATSAR